MRSLRWIFLPSICFAIFHLAVAQTPLDAFNKGNEFYRAGQFEQAVKEYESVVRQGYGSAPLYFNLGNAYYRQAKIAPAILAYERAAHLDPNDPDIEHNLQLANFRAVDRIESLPELFLVQWLREIVAFLPLVTTTKLFLVSWILFFGTLAVMYIVRQETALRFARGVLIIAGILLAPVSALFATQLVQIRSHDDAILMDKIITAKTSPDEHSVDAFVVHEGLKVKLGDTVSDWVKITLADGKLGWIRQSQCERI